MTMIAQPRHHTPRTPGAKTLGGKAALIGKALGRPPHEWQRRALDVALELDDNGRLRYSNVFLSVPRQCGKTVIAVIAGMTRVLMQDGAKVWYTAQTGQMARERWITELATPVRTKLPGLARVKFGAGDTRLTIPSTLSEFRPMPPSADYLHGAQSDMILVDEAWSHSEASGELLMQACRPTFQSRIETPLGTQLWRLSTAGTAESTWWHNALGAAIEGQPSTCVIDWGLPLDADPTDVEAVIAAHPLGHRPALANFLRDEAADMTTGQFARAYGNRATASRDRIIPLDAWEAAQSHAAIPTDAPVSFGAAIDIGRTETVIAACSVVDGCPMIEVVDRRPGVNWAADRLIDLMETHGASPPVVDPVGPSGTLHDELVGRGVDMPSFGVRDLTRACASLMDAITHTTADGAPDPLVKIRPDDGLDFSADVVERRKVGDAWAWQRSVTGSIASLEAATLAMHGATHRPAPALAPMIVTLEDS